MLDNLCMDHILSFVSLVGDIGRLRVCFKQFDADLFWRRQCILIYGHAYPNAQEMVLRAKSMKAFARTQEAQLQRNGGFNSLYEDRIFFSPSNTICSASDLYLRFRHGSKVYEQWFPSGTFLHSSNEICLPMNIPTWPLLRQAQKYFNTRDFGFEPSVEPRYKYSSSTWESMSVFLVSLQRGVPELFSAAHSYQGRSGMDFVNHEPHDNAHDDPIVPTCTTLYDRFWFFDDVEWTGDPFDCDCVLGLVCDVTQIKWLVWKRLSY